MLIQSRRPSITVLKSVASTFLSKMLVNGRIQRHRVVDCILQAEIERRIGIVFAARLTVDGHSLAVGADAGTRCKSPNRDNWRSSRSSSPRYRSSSRRGCWPYAPACGRAESLNRGQSSAPTWYRCSLPAAKDPASHARWQPVRRPASRRHPYCSCTKGDSSGPRPSGRGVPSAFSTMALPILSLKSV